MAEFGPCCQREEMQRDIPSCKEIARDREIRDHEVGGSTGTTATMSLSFSPSGDAEQVQTQTFDDYPESGSDDLPEHPESSVDGDLAGMP